LRLSWLFAGLDLAEVLTRTSPKAAVDVLDEVSSAADRMGATNIAASADLRMRRLGARPWRRGSSAGDGLSERERAVVELLVTGASNPEIAAALFLSRKTVERHVSNIIAKLGVRNRAEVVACMVPRGAGQAAVPARAAGQPEGPHR
jgi:DNA-binding NarL/FixJ family response regulator